jgi:hypothetical protein
MRDLFHCTMIIDGMKDNAMTPLQAPTRRTGASLAPSLASWVVWSLVGVSVAAWGWPLWSQEAPQALPLPVAEPIAANTQAVAKALGAGDTRPGLAPARQQASAPTAVGLALTGLARDASGAGVALIAAEGRPTAAYRVGALVTDNWRLQALHPHEAVLQSVQAPTQELRLALPERTTHQRPDD